jgi:hypothetical protein
MTELSGHPILPFCKPEMYGFREPVCKFFDQIEAWLEKIFIFTLTSDV